MIKIEDFFKTIGRITGLGLLVTSLLSVTIFASGCSSSQGSAENGVVVISMTDAEGDFLTYAVDVTSMKLVKNNGAVVESLPETTTIDFAQYVDATEFLTAATVPSGRYASAELTLDFSNAVITVQDELGNAIAATAIDGDGLPLTTMTVVIELNGDSQFRVAPGIPAHFTIDFDLESSNEVVINGDTATVAVNPVLIADTQLKDPKPHRLRGLLGETDKNTSTFEVVMMPFLHHQHHNFGALKAHTASTTVYEINGVEYTGSAGFDALATLDKGEAVVANGILDYKNRQYNATTVLAGSSVPWGTKDILRGSVISRDHNSLIVHGGVILRASGDYIFKENIEVLLSENTRVYKQGEADTAHMISDISVGQRVTVLGVPAITIDDSYVLDASEGSVRMYYSQVTGLINTVSPLAIDTQRINGRRSDVYDFTGTGSDPSTDADPTNYEIDTGMLPLDQLAANDPIKVRGFPKPFGQAPEDFIAKTLMDVSQVVSYMVVGYTQLGSDTAIVSADETGLQLSLDGAGLAHYLEMAGVVIDLNSLDAAPFVQPRESGEGLFVIAKRGHVNVFANYTDFVQALNNELASGVKVRGVNVFGQYDSDLNSINTIKIGVQVIDPVAEVLSDASTS